MEDSTVASTADSSQSKTLNYFKPRIALNVTPNAVVRLGIRVEHEVGQLNFADNVIASAILDRLPSDESIPAVSGKQ